MEHSISTSGSTSGSSSSFWKTLEPYLHLLFLLAGLFLTIISFFQLCSTACAQTHHYRLYGFPFELGGLAFFSSQLLLFTLRQHGTIFQTLYRMAIFTATGAEVYFIWVQDALIGSWCPVCLSIAAMVFSLALLVSFDFFYTLLSSNRKDQRRTPMNYWSSFRTLPCLALGFFIAFFGVAKEEKLFASSLEAGNSPFLGNPTSSTEIIVFTDWFCPACRKIDDKLEGLFQPVMPYAKIVFIDVPIHDDSMNFLPYNISFMIYEKGKYFQLRHLLHELAQKNKKPTDQEIEAMAQSINASYKELSFSELNLGMKFFRQTAEKYDVETTPTIVVTDTKSKKVQKLVGSDEILQANFSQLIKSIR